MHERIGDNVVLKNTTTMSFKVQVLLALTVVGALLYGIFTYFQQSQDLTQRLAQMQMKYRRAKTERKKYETMYETCHSNEEMYQTSNRQLKVNLATTNKELAETVRKANALKMKFTDAFLFYKEMKVLASVTDEQDGKNKESVDSDITTKIKEKMDQLKARAIALKEVEREHSALVGKYRNLTNEHASIQQNVNKLQDVNGQLNTDKLQIASRNEEMTQKYNNLTELYKKLFDKVNMYKDKVTMIKKPSGSAKKLGTLLKDGNIKLYNSVDTKSSTGNKNTKSSESKPLTDSVNTGRPNDVQHSLTQHLVSGIKDIGNKMNNIISTSVHVLNSTPQNFSQPTNLSKIDVRNVQEVKNDDELEHSFDEEDKFEPPSSEDKLNEYGLSELGAADEEKKPTVVPDERK